MSKYLSPDFDRERGDLLLIPREDALSMVEAGPEISAPILFNLIKWFSGQAVPYMEDPRDRRDLSRLIEHQKENVARQIIKAQNNQRGPAVRFGKAANDGETTHGEEMRTQENECERKKTNANAPKISKVKDKEQVQVQALSLNTCTHGEKMTGCAPGVAAGVSAGADAAAHCDTVKSLEEDGSIRHEWKEVDLYENPVQFALDYAEERSGGETRNNHSFRPSLLKYIGKVKKPKFCETIWCIVKEADEKDREFDKINKLIADGVKGVEYPKDDYSYYEHIDRTILGRLKTLSAGLD